MLNFFKKPIEPTLVTPKHWVHTINENNALSPDIRELEQKVSQFLFVPAEMKEGYDYHEVISNHLDWFDPDPRGYTCQKILAFTTKNYEMYKKHLGRATRAIPMVASKKPDLFSDKGPARIKGELYKVYSSHFKELDKYYMNGVLFTRERVNLFIPVRKVIQTYDYAGGIETSKITGIINFHVEAWMYLGIKDWWDHEITNMFFSEVRIQHSDNEKNRFKFYHFTRGDCFNKR